MVGQQKVSRAGVSQVKAKPVHNATSHLWATVVHYKFHTYTNKNAKWLQPIYVSSAHFTRKIHFRVGQVRVIIIHTNIRSFRIQRRGVERYFLLTAGRSG